MKKLILFFLLFIPTAAVAQSKIEYNYKTGATMNSEVEDIVKRCIYQKDNTIIIDNYFNDTGLNLTLIIDKKENDKKLGFLPRNDDAPWYYCHSAGGDKYVLIGLNTKKVDLYCIYSELEIKKETFE